MNPENLYLLAQLIKSEEEIAKKLDEFYNKKDTENFQKAKKELIEFQNKITQILDKWQ